MRAALKSPAMLKSGFLALLVAVCVCGSVFFLDDQVNTATGAPTYTFTNCRFGVGTDDATEELYDITGFNFGTYMNWKSLVTPYSFGGADYLQMIHVDDEGGVLSYSPSGNQLRNRILANPGAIWLIGNEPDRPGIGFEDLYPEQYAEVYHDVYVYIKSVDPSAQVSAGGIVQPSPARLVYLHRVYTSYFAMYGTALPTDVWNIHNYNYNEVPGEFGADMPPGVDANLATQVDLYDFDDVDAFKNHIVAFRQWMNNHGYRNTPLIITEFGPPLPYHPSQGYVLCEDLGGGNELCHDEAFAIGFMSEVYDYLMTATDANIGYPADSSRLVQQWVWFHQDNIDFGGYVFDPQTGLPSQLGYAMKDYMAQIAPQQDLIAVRLEQVAPVVYSNGPVSVTLRAQISNAGNIPVQQQVEITFTDGDDQVIGTPQTMDLDLAGCGRFVDIIAVWPNLSAGTHTVTVTVDSGDVILESSELNNSVSTTVFVSRNQLYLPFAMRVQAYY